MSYGAGMTDSAHTQHSVLSCEACRIIDRLDGIEDGRIFNLDHWKVQDERKHFQNIRTSQDLLADKITAFAGSLTFVYIHLVWFLLWVLANIGAFGSNLKFDGFPFGLLTMAVSLEAIFLATFVMVSQNRQAARSDIRAKVDFESNLQSLIWLVHLGHKLNLDINHVHDLCAEAIEESRKGLE